MKVKPREILVTDKAFEWGHEATECSRCGKEIPGYRVVAYGDPGETWFQYHPECVGAQPKKTYSRNKRSDRPSNP